LVLFIYIRAVKVGTGLEVSPLSSTAKETQIFSLKEYVQHRQTTTICNGLQVPA